MTRQRSSVSRRSISMIPFNQTTFSSSLVFVLVILSLQFHFTNASNAGNMAVIRSPPNAKSEEISPGYAFFNRSEIPLAPENIQATIATVSPLDACQECVLEGKSSSWQGQTWHDRLVLVEGNQSCSMATKLENVQNAMIRAGYSRQHLKGLIVRYYPTFIDQIRNESRDALNDTDSDILHVPILLMYPGDWLWMMNHTLSQPATMHLYIPPTFDFSAIGLLALGVFTLVVSSIIGAYNHPWYRGVLQTKKSRPSYSPSEEPRQHREEESQTMTIVSAILFVVTASAGLTLFYFFPNILIWIVLGLFCFAGFTSVLAVAESTMSNVAAWRQLRTRTEMCKISDMTVSVCDVVEALWSAGIITVWFYYRKSDWVWVLQDFIGICFMIQIFKAVSLPSLQVATILLSLAFCYDVFMVFITPFFTKSGQSVMETVARGGSTGEKVPLLLEMPRFNDELGGYSMLGFGDIVLPGLLVCMCKAWDLATREVAKPEPESGNTTPESTDRPSTSSATAPLLVREESREHLHNRTRMNRSPPKSNPSIVSKTQPSYYFPVIVIGYALGLIVTFIAVSLMKRGQPALLYLVPMTVIPTILYAKSRKELKTLWNGELLESLGIASE